MPPDMNDSQKIAEAKKLAAGPLGETLGKFPLLFAKATLCGQRPTPNVQSQFNCGTISLIDLGAGPIGITCQHVVQNFRDRQKNESNVIFQVGGVELNPLAQLIDENERLDLATIRFSKDQIDSITAGGEIGSCVFKPKSWPSPSLKQGEFVAFGGFPKTLRTLGSRLTKLCFQVGAAAPQKFRP